MRAVSFSPSLGLPLFFFRASLACLAKLPSMLARCLGLANLEVFAIMDNSETCPKSIPATCSSLEEVSQVPSSTSNSMEAKYLSEGSFDIVTGV